MGYAVMLGKLCSLTGLGSIGMHWVAEAAHLPELSLINAVIGFKHFVVLSTVEAASKALLF